MKTIKILFFVSLTSILFSSCKDNFFDIQPTDKFSSEVVFSSKAEINVAVNELYFESTNTFGVTGDPKQPWFPQCFQYFYDALCDDAYASMKYVNTQTITNGALGSGNYGCFENKWKNTYTGVKACNQFLKDLDKSTVDSISKKTFRDEARFLRAYLYFDLVKLFGGVPLVLDVYNINNYKCVPRSSSDECFTFIISELDDILRNSLLPASYKDLDDNLKGKVTMAAVHALKTEATMFFIRCG